MFIIKGLGFRFEAQGLGFRVYCLRFGVTILGFKDLGGGRVKPPI